MGQLLVPRQGERGGEGETGQASCLAPPLKLLLHLLTRVVNFVAIDVISFVIIDVVINVVV